MRTLIILFITISLLGQGCSGPDKKFEELLKSPGDFHGQLIEITGVIHERFEDNAIYLTANSSTDKAVWIEYSDLFMLLNTFKGLDGRRVKVKGEFDRDDKGHLGQYIGTLKKAIILVNE